MTVSSLWIVGGTTVQSPALKAIRVLVLAGTRNNGGWKFVAHQPGPIWRRCGEMREPGK